MCRGCRERAQTTENSYKRNVGEDPDAVGCSTAKCTASAELQGKLQLLKKSKWQCQETYKRYTNDKDILYTAPALDPRFKFLPLSGEEVLDTFDKITAEVAEQYQRQTRGKRRTSQDKLKLMILKTQRATLEDPLQRGQCVNLVVHLKLYWEVHSEALGGTFRNQLRK
ncbi:hypothetical protein N1851_006506 [Merluccius polli]|uniref:Uncharacterized protein n=1 Tax=Merluccius polli TaxID=89951 RepID=A0AA47N5A4_MERPO|nr:hypothetical protein N1851_006506 [Merluccius polli]